jgi:hypothetical protein
MITANAYDGLKMSNSDGDLVDLGLVDLDLETHCDSSDCTAERPYGNIRFKVVELTHSTAYCALLNAEKDKLARRFQVDIPGESYLHLGGIVTAVRISNVPNTEHLVMNATVTLTAGPMHDFTCS